MRKIFLLLSITLFVGCGGASGPPVASVGPKGVQSYNKGQAAKLYAWDDIQALTLSGHLIDPNKQESAQILRIRTKDSPNKELASSYPRRVDSKAYGGMYVGLSISQSDLDELKASVISGAGLVPHPKDDKVWFRPKDATSFPPTETRSYIKKIGS